LGSVKSVRPTRWILAAVSAFLTHCTFAEESLITGKIYEAKQTEQLFPQSALPGSGSPFWTPSRLEIRSLERALPDFLTAHWPPRRGPMVDLSKYKAQYFGVSRDGKKLIFINAFCDEFAQRNPDWANRFVGVADGGSCFFYLFYDPSTNSLSDLYVNSWAHTLPNKALQLPSASIVSLHRRTGSLRSPAALAVWRRNVVR
jgi:hypothetical protein